ncbi:hypothetical protein [Mycobacterium sp. SMC-14]|uniref:hypothetical protein n=1 Tax=Mycobacterium sp. SMC-14 TaxID=3385968 RepID=UPI00390CA90A
MTDNRRPGSLLARIRAKLAAPAAAAELVAEPEPDAAPEPPRRAHLFGSQFRVRMSFDELMGTRGYLGEQGPAERRRLVPSSDGQRQRDAAARRAGYLPGEVMWPSE